MPERAVPGTPAPEGDEMVRAMPSADCPIGTPQEPELRLVSVAGTEIILVRLPEGDVVALASRCPHQGTDLVDASFFDGHLRCPHHLYLYDPRTGENVVPCRDARPEILWKLKPGYLPTHQVEERDGWIWVAPRPRPPPPAYDPDRERRPLSGEQGPSGPLSGEQGPGGPLSGEQGPSGPLSGEQGPSGPLSGEQGPVEHPAKTVRVRPGTIFELRLPVDGRPGHVWRVEVADGPLEILDERFDPTDPPRHRVRLAARGAGTATVRCAFSRPWEALPAETRTYLVRIESEPVT